MGLAISILAALMIIGSMMWVLPSPREVRQRELRKQALSLGLTIRLASLDDPRAEDGKLHCVAYQMFRSVPKRKVAWVLSRDAILEADATRREPGWKFDKGASTGADTQEAVLERAALLPEDVVRIEVDAEKLMLYWQERGAVEDVQGIVDFLSSC